MKTSALFYLFNLIISLLLWFIIFPTNSYASIFYEVTPPSGQNYQVIIPPDPCLDQGPAECANSHNIGNCGDPPCTGGVDWYRYEMTCLQKRDPDTGALSYDAYYNRGPAICSIGDKCHAGEIGLHYGSCTCGVEGPAIYKYCCTPQGQDQQCTSIGVTQDKLPPPEGQCPGGSVIGDSNSSGYVSGSTCVPLVTCDVDTNPPLPNPFNVCGKTGGCADNYDANHTVSVTRELCTDNTNRWSCQDLGLINGPCYQAPTLNSFSGSDACWKASPLYSATLTWTGTPFDTGPGGCGIGFWVDISTDAGFNFFSNKCVTGTSLTNFNGSEDWMNQGNFSFNSGTKYYARVYNGTHSNTRDLTVPATCSTDTPPTCTMTLDGNASETVNPGGPVNIFTSASDDVRVNTVQLFNGTTPISPALTNPIISNTYGVNYGWFAPFVEGTYTIRATATDSSGQTGTCQAPLIVQGTCPAQPTNLTPRGTINSCATLYTLSWSPPPLADSWYNVRVDDNDPSAVNATSGTANTCTAHDICIDNYQGNSLAITIKPGKTYTWWVDTGSSNTSCTQQTASTSFSPVCSTTSTVTGTAGCVEATSTGSKIDWLWNQAGTCGTGSYTKLRLSDLTTSQTQDFTPSSNQTSFTSTSLTASHNFTLGVFDNSGGTTPTCLSAPVASIDCAPGAPPPPPGPIGCSICMGGNCSSSAQTSSAGNSFTITSNKPTAPQTINIDGPASQSFGPFSSTSQTITWQSDVANPGTYTVSNGSCARSITLSGASCDQLYGSSSLNIYTFSDPAFDPAQWPQYHWVGSSSSTCSGGDQGSLSTQSNLASATNNSSAVLGASSCWTGNDCNDNNICTADNCAGAQLTPGCDWVSGEFVCWLPHQGTCSNPPDQNKVLQVCGTSPNGGNMYCGVDSVALNHATGVCSDNFCDTNKNTTEGPSLPGLNPECKDGNLCTKDICSPPTNSEGDYIAGFGTCSPQAERYGTVCSSNAYCGGNPTTTVGDSICHTMPANAGTSKDISGVLCKTNNDCNDGNECTEDVCGGYQAAGCDPDNCWPEKLGHCSRTTTFGSNTVNTNQPATFSCQKDSGGNPLKLCDGGSSPFTLPTSPGFQLSQCTVDYVACNDVIQNNANCCGIVNIQGKACTGDCRLAQFPVDWNTDSKNPFRPELGTVEVPTTGLKNVVIHVDNDQCNIHQTKTTGSSGGVGFAIVPYIGTSSRHQRLQYTVSAEIPTSYQFTRGTLSHGTSASIPDPLNPATQRIGPGGSPSFTGYEGYYQSTPQNDISGNDRMTFGFFKPSAPWIQTTSGDVHSNTNISTPGGPR